MPWKETTNMSQRAEFIKQAEGEGVNFSALCRLYGISRKTAEKIITFLMEKEEINS